MSTFLVNETVYYYTPEGLVEMVIVSIQGEYAKVVWCEHLAIGTGKDKGKEAIVHISLLRKVEKECTE